MHLFSLTVTECRSGQLCYQTTMGHWCGEEWPSHAIMSANGMVMVGWKAKGGGAGLGPSLGLRRCKPRAHNSVLWQLNFFCSSRTGELCNLYECRVHFCSFPLRRTVMTDVTIFCGSHLLTQGRKILSVFCPITDLLGSSQGDLKRDAG